MNYYDKRLTGIWINLKELKDESDHMDNYFKELRVKQRQKIEKHNPGFVATSDYVLVEVSMKNQHLPAEHKKNIIAKAYTEGQQQLILSRTL